MPTKTLKHDRKVNRNVLAALETHVEPAGKLVDKEIAAAGVGQACMENAAGAAQGLLDLAFDEYEKAEKLVVAEGGDDDAARGQRAAAVNALYETLSGLGGAVAGAFGRETAERLRLTGTTPRTPDELVSATKRFLAASDPMPPLPSPRSAWNAPNVVAARAVVADQEEALSAALEHLDNETKQTEGARSARDRAKARWDTELRFAIDQARSILKRAGQADLAAKVLPTERQIAQIDPLPDEDDEDDE